MKKTIYFFIGTTAEFIKVAPVIKKLQQKNVSIHIVTSGQTKILFDEFTEYFGKKLKITYSFTEKEHRSSILLFGFWTIKTFLHALVYFHQLSRKVDKKNTFFVVHGDTVSSFIGAIAIRICGLQLVHIEAGLRSFNFFEPFPEELCRFAINYLSHINFCQNEWSLKNIEKIPSKKN